MHKFQQHDSNHKIKRNVLRYCAFKKKEPYENSVHNFTVRLHAGLDQLR